MRQSKGLLVLSLILIPWLVSKVDSCSCAHVGPPCEAYREATAVFVGVVIDIAITPLEREVASEKETYRGKRIRFSVEQSFKGVDGLEVEVQTNLGAGGSADCGYPFKQGERYLVYAHRDSVNRKLTTSICTRTALFSKDNEDLDYLRGLPDSNSKTRISGRVIRYTNERDKNGYQLTAPISAIKVIATGQGQSFETFTNDDGVYQLIGLPPGKYKVRADLPRGLSEHTQEVELPSAGCAGADIRTQSDGRISGRVIDSNGQPTSNARVDLIPADTENEQIILMKGEHERTDNQGNYEFKEISPGRYYLGINLREEPRGEFPYPRTYFPGVADQGKATIIVLVDGQKQAGYDVILPPRIEVRGVEGVFLWSDGRPVTRGSVYLKDSAEHLTGRVYASAEVDAKGHFSLQGFERLECWLVGTTYSTAGGRMQFINTRPIKIVVNSALNAIILIAPAPRIITKPNSRTKTMP